MTTTTFASDPDRCATCGVILPERSPTSPAVRYCERDWWREQARRFDAGEDVSPYALDVLQRGRRPYG